MSVNRCCFGSASDFVFSYNESSLTMDLIKAEIERKRKQLLEKQLVGPERKFFKREELIKKEQEEYLERHRKQTSQNEESETTPSSSSSNVESVVIATSADGSSTTTEKILPRKEVIRRLRERGEPILMFGETEVDSFRRLRQIEIQEPEMNRGLRNDFQEAMDQVDQAYLNEMLKAGGTTSSGQDGKDSKGSLNDVKIQETDTDIDKIKELAKSLSEGKTGPNRPIAETKRDAQVIHTFLRYLLELWGKKLNGRTEDEKTSMKGKISSATYTQTQTYLRPLFKQLKTGKISNDILRHLVIIIQHLLDREYVKANDAYLQMAIGNAPWPIGVTMVGIHARTGREKIFSQNIAHVLNDETQRKYIQALKRLMTQCQYFFPTDPSKCVEYNALGES